MPYPPYKPHVCTTCPVPHIDNCEWCFGFGVYVDRTAGGRPAPVAASEAITGRKSRGFTDTDEPIGPTMPCPVCGSTTAGVPVAAS